MIPRGKPVATPTDTNGENGLKSLLFPSANSAQRALGSAAGRRKVVLAPGHSPLDWAELNSLLDKHKLRGVGPGVPPPQYVRVSPAELKQHLERHDCWTCIDNKIYNITPYVNFHPGGAEEILKCAGRDGTSLFNKYHRWVNAERMLQNCWIGVKQP